MQYGLTVTQRKILEYVEKKGIAYPSDISKDLGLDYENLVLLSLRLLNKRKLIDFGSDDFSVTSSRRKNYP